MDHAKYRSAAYRPGHPTPRTINVTWPNDVVDELAASVREQMGQSPPPIEDCSLYVIIKPYGSNYGVDDLGTTFATKVIWAKDDEAKTSLKRELGCPVRCEGERQLIEAIWGERGVN